MITTSLLTIMAIALTAILVGGAVLVWRAVVRGE